MSELKPCPFCGGDALLRERWVAGVANTKHYRYECHECKATFANWYRSVKKAIAAWNRRASGLVKCSETTPKPGRYIVANGPVVKEALLDKDGQWYDAEWYVLNYVSHYMPLPEPPEVDE